MSETGRKEGGEEKGGERFSELKKLLNPAEMPKPLPARKRIIMHPSAFDEISLVLGLFSIVPFVGLVAGAAAVLFGTLGLLNGGRYRNDKYYIHKSIIGIVLGAAFFLFYLWTMTNMFLMVMNADF